MVKSWKYLWRRVQRVATHIGTGTVPEEFWFWCGLKNTPIANQFSFSGNTRQLFNSYGSTVPESRIRTFGFVAFSKFLTGLASPRNNNYLVKLFDRGNPRSIGKGCWWLVEGGVPWSNGGNHSILWKLASTHHLGTGERCPGWLALPLGDLHIQIFNSLMICLVVEENPPAPNPEKIVTRITII